MEQATGQAAESSVPVGPSGKPKRVVKGGRPTRLTPELIAKIVNAVKAGNYVETAVAWAGVHKAQFYDWLKKGAAAKSGIYKEFHDALEMAWAESEVRDVAAIGTAAQQTWTAAAWRLERKFPHRWGRMDRMEVTGKEGGPLEAKHEHSITPEALTLASAIASALERLPVQEDSAAGERAGGAGEGSQP